MNAASRQEAKEPRNKKPVKQKAAKETKVRSPLLADTRRLAAMVECFVEEEEKWTAVRKAACRRRLSLMVPASVPEEELGDAVYVLGLLSMAYYPARDFRRQSLWLLDHARSMRPVVNALVKSESVESVQSVSEGN